MTRKEELKSQNTKKRKRITPTAEQQYQDDNDVVS